MTDKHLEELGFYMCGGRLNQIGGFGHVDMELGPFGLHVKDFKTLTALELIEMIYEAGKKEGYKKGGNSVRYQIHDILKIED